MAYGAAGAARRNKDLGLQLVIWRVGSEAHLAGLLEHQFAAGIGVVDHGDTDAASHTIL